MAINCRVKSPKIHQASGCADDVEKDHLLTHLSILSADTELGKMQPATAAASTERIMRQKVEIDHGYAENDAKKKKHGHENISPTSIGNEDDGRTDEKQNRMSNAVPSAINRSLAQEMATGMLYHHSANPSRLSY